MLDQIRNLSFRARIILTFSFITVLLVAVISKIGYETVREIYLNQLSGQVDTAARVTGQNLDPQYLAFLEPGNSGTTAARFYRAALNKQGQTMQLIQTFIFDRNFRVLLAAGQPDLLMNPDPALMLNRGRISRLTPGETAVSLPFKGHDGLWYMWGFYRLNDTFYLGVQENADRLARVDQLALIFWGIGIGAILLTAVAGWWLAQTLSRPVNRLVAFSGKLGAGDFSAPLPPGIHGELGILAGALDRMRTDLARLHRDQEEMLAQIAHEIRNPLGGIELLSGLIREDLEKHRLDTRYARKISREIGGLKSLISAYLNYSRPLQARPEWTAVQQQAAEVRELLRDRLVKKHISVTVQPELPALWFDPNHLRQILVNLLSNSLDAHPGNGEIRIGVENSGDGTLLRVSDDGPGIPAEYLPRLFEPFFSTREEGTGLGLAICRKLCEENHAEIRAENNRGGGCSFLIRPAKVRFK